MSCVRLSGGITVRGTTMELDTESYAEGPGETTGGNAYNTRIVWGDMRGAGTPGGLVQDCSFVLQSYDNSQGLVTILENPHIDVRESQFLLNDDIIAVNADDGEIELNNSTFDGDAPATAGAGDVTGRNNCVTGSVNPGAVPTSPRHCRFNWGRVHPLGQPDG